LGPHVKRVPTSKLLKAEIACIDVKGLGDPCELALGTLKATLNAKHCISMVGWNVLT